MKKSPLKKILLTSVSVFMVLVVVLCVHIYIVTRPQAPTAATIAMARIDLHQAISHQDAANITDWLYRQPGIDHVVCNPTMDNIVFTFHPAIAKANDIVSNFKTGMHYDHAVRYLPSEKEMQSGCPVASTSYTYKVYSFFKHTL